MICLWIMPSEFHRNPLAYPIPLLVTQPPFHGQIHPIGNW